MSCHVTSCHVTSRHVTSRHVTSHHVMSRHFMSCHVMWCHVMSLLKLLLLWNYILCCYVVMSCHIMSFHVMSSCVSSCHVVSFSVPFYLPFTHSPLVILLDLMMPNFSYTQMTCNCIYLVLNQITPKFPTAKNLAVVIDEFLTLKPHISNLCKATSFQLRKISMMRLSQTFALFHIVVLL